MKKCECGQTSDPNGNCDGTHEKLKGTYTKIKEAVCKGICTITGNKVRLGWCRTKCC